MKTAKELEDMFDISEDEIERIDSDAARGVLQGKATSTVTGPGRPPIFDEPMQVVTFKESTSTLQAIDRRARQLGMHRSEYLRQLVENDLRCAAN